MKNFLQKIKDFYLKTKNREEVYKRKEINPTKDWVNILILFFTIFSILMIFSIYLYVRIKGDRMFTVSKTETINEVKVDKTLLDKTIEDINMRKKITEDLKEGKKIPLNP